MINLLRLFRYLKDEIPALSFSLVFLLVASGLNLLQPKLVEWAVDVGIGAGDLPSVVWGALGIAGAALLSSGLHVASGVLLVRAGQGMAYSLRNDLFKKVTSLSFADLDRWRTGELMVRVNADVNTVRMFIRMGLLMMINSVVMIAGSLTLMYRTNAQLSRVMFVVLPGTLVLFLVFAVIIRPLVTRVRERLDNVNNVLQENLAGAKVVRAFAQHVHEKARFEKRNHDYYALSLRVGYLVAMAYPFLFFLGQLAVILLTWLGGTEVIRGMLGDAGASLTLGQLLAFNNYAILSSWPIMSLGFVLQFLAVASASAIRIQELFDQRPAIREPTEPRRPERIRGEITFENVCFAYAGSGEDSGTAVEPADAVDHLTFRIRPGEKVGILGRTGSGKSTVAALIPRYYDVGSGRVTIDGVDVRNYSLDLLRRRVLVVMQETLLMSGTIRENVGFAVRAENPGASGDGRLEAAAELAHATQFIRDKDHGWEETVGERGTGLSGGQRQRIAIARALAADPDVLILDDATSALDSATERAIVQNLYDHLAEKTVLIISQRVNTVLQADRIMVMDQGRITGFGTHQELLEQNHIYREIYESQTAELRG